MVIGAFVAVPLPVPVPVAAVPIIPIPVIIVVAAVISVIIALVHPAVEDICAGVLRLNDRTGTAAVADAVTCQQLSACAVVIEEPYITDIRNTLVVVAAGSGTGICVGARGTRVGADRVADHSARGRYAVVRTIDIRTAERTAAADGNVIGVGGQVFYIRARTDVHTAAGRAGAQLNVVDLARNIDGRIGSIGGKPARLRAGADGNRRAACLAAELDSAAVGGAFQVDGAAVALDLHVTVQCRMISGYADTSALDHDGPGNVGMVKHNACARAALGNIHAARRAAQGDGTGGVDDGQAVRGISTGT